MAVAMAEAGGMGFLHYNMAVCKFDALSLASNGFLD